MYEPSWIQSFLSSDTCFYFGACHFCVYVYCVSFMYPQIVLVSFHIGSFLFPYVCIVSCILYFVCIVSRILNLYALYLVFVCVVSCILYFVFVCVVCVVSCILYLYALYLFFFLRLLSHHYTFRPCQLPPISPCLIFKTFPITAITQLKINVSTDDFLENWTCHPPTHHMEFKSQN